MGNQKEKRNDLKRMVKLEEGGGGCRESNITPIKRE
jgi:hypothetical protein